jgi:tetratricopeptide (TPR) repeat protein
MLKLAQVCFIGLIVSSAVSCSREPVKEKPVDVVVAEPNKKDPVVEPKKEKVTEAELDKEPSAPIVEALALEDDKVNYEKALRDHNEAIRLDPKNAKAYNARAWVWATCPSATFRDGKKAVESASRAVELAANKTNFDTLAAAHAENGDFAEAVRWQEKVLADPNVIGDGDYFGYRQRLELYRDKKPYRQERPHWQQARLKVSADPRFTVDALFEAWQDGKVLSSFVATNSFFRIQSGEIAITIDPKEFRDGPYKGNSLEVIGAAQGTNGVNSKVSSNAMQRSLFPKGMPLQGAIRTEKIEARDGSHVVWAWTAGKQAESKKPNETLEEAAQRSEFALLVKVTIQRRQDSHRITLAPPQKGILVNCTMVFVGPSFKKALEDWKDVACEGSFPFEHGKFNAAQILAEKVKVDANNPKLGSAEFMIHKWRISPPVQDPHLGTETLTLERLAADSPDWVLTAESREKIKKLAGAP